MRTTLNLQDEVYEAARSIARTSGKPLGEVVSELARKGLQPRSSTRKHGLPMFDVPAGAPMIPGMRATEILDDEGAE